MNKCQAVFTLSSCVHGGDNAVSRTRLVSVADVAALWLKGNGSADPAAEGGSVWPSEKPSGVFQTAMFRRPCSDGRISDGLEARIFAEHLPPQAAHVLVMV
ncbi:MULTISPECIES: hypothetical protein [unclassified Neisseria]|uniref:hypothetical protein n=1 Tax=unclassified Neisseria TaxID=2623750 RepID=UPI001071E85A|nr:MULTISPECIES: hypothetical protein [unclassified Neisseria]MBF0804507.1 hypothetical protein [Neisseria sp. 19428wB4_WF04]TFU40485.1 hypothetical protein E4T99_09155 [Neisseria sp. WF04]